jgi:hypothetical protein
VSISKGRWLWEEETRTILDGSRAENSGVVAPHLCAAGYYRPTEFERLAICKISIASEIIVQ